MDMGIKAFSVWIAFLMPVWPIRAVLTNSDVWSMRLDTLVFSAADVGHDDKGFWPFIAAGA